MSDALRQLYPQVVRTIGDVAYDANGAVVQYDATAVTNLVANNQYKVSRSREYPQITDQLDMLWHAINTNSLNQTSDFYTTIKAVKDKYPKS